MALSELERVELVKALTTSIGVSPAGNLMDCIFPEGKDHVATKDDIKMVETKVDAGFTEVHAKIDGGFAKIDGEFAKVDGEFAKIDGRFAKIDGRFTKIDGEFERLRGEVALMLAQQTRTVLIAVVACMVTTWAGMLASFLTLASMING